MEKIQKLDSKLSENIGQVAQTTHSFSNDSSLEEDYRNKNSTPEKVTFNELDNDDITNVTGAVITSSDDDKNSRNLPFKLYEHYASIQRSYEDKNDPEGLREELTRQLFDPHSNLSLEKIESQQKIRVANRYAVFFLITTDILGPNNAPYAFSRLGYVGGIILYILFGVWAILGGKLLNVCFLKLDSDNYPIRTFSDLASRILAPWTRYIIALIQFIQMILNVGLLCLNQGQALSQIIKSTDKDPKICFTVQVLIWAVLGMLTGQIKSLRSLSFVANTAIWMNIAVCIITMVGAAKFEPNYYTSPLPPYQPIEVHANSVYGLNDKIVGVDQMIFAWGGGTMFCEIMAEMAKPRMFVTGMVCADLLIMVVYLFFGLFVYSFQGQYVYVVASQGINPYGLRLASNIVSLVSGVIAASLYGNVGLKIIYQGFGVPDLNFPKLTTKLGTLCWGVMVIIYWSVAFLIVAAVPQVKSLSSLVGSLCILNFTYTFPILFMLGIVIRDDAGALDVYDPLTGKVTAPDTWKDWSRWKRAIVNGDWKHNLFKGSLVIMLLGALCLCGIGMYGAIYSMIKTFSVGVAGSKPFGCTPANYNAKK